MVGHVPISMRMNALACFANIVEHESIPKKIIIWGWKVLGMYKLVKGPNMAILK